MSKITRDQITGMNFHYKHYPLEYFLDAMVQYECKKIELWGASPHFYVDELTLSEMRKIKREIDRRDLSVVCFTPEQCVYPINLAAKEERIRERSIQYFLKSAEAAKELGAPLLLVTPGWGYENEDSQEAWKRTRDSLEKLADVAARLELTLALEPLTRVESNIICDAKSLKKMLEEVNSPSLKGMIDTIPMALANEDFNDYFNLLKDEIVHIHFIDGKPEGHLVWGDGVLPLQTYVDQLSQHGYQGALTLEYTSYQYVQDPDQAMERTLDVLSGVLSD
ncbi:sugar phosphate isomerase/epimerase family protein [Neobacillus cucumis]|uniref:sugar phosphate isomerase/epimerase family protein n=1 Tax=Neobacillus cucumis TaxID=1740721 RepID=UPI001964C77F|nr:TIM barrel protein [Neobacillus cucumis]MBM7652679.1 protein FrlC [Neobacillus cucumis]